MNEIGGYMGLELPNSIHGEFLHSDGRLLNTGTNAIEYIFRVKSPIHCVWLSYYTCDCVLDPIKKLNLPYRFYRIDDKMEIMQSSIDVASDDIVIYNNYFGIKDAYVEKLFSQLGSQLLIDNAQSYGSPYILGSNTIYSPRKSFGVSDGGVAYVDNDDDSLFDNLDQDYSNDRFAHLLKRFELSAAIGYDDFLRNGKTLMNLPLRKMSILTKSILCTFDYEKARKTRRQNFQYLHNALTSINPLSNVCEEITKNAFPAFYPFYTDDDNLRSKLINHKVYVATYWPNVLEWLRDDINSTEFDYAKHILPLPIDQRYSVEEMQRIVRVLNGE